MKRTVIDVANVAEIPNVIAKIIAEVEQNFRDASYEEVLREKVVPLLSDEHEELFNRQQSPTGEAWKPLAPSTVKRKGHDVILIETNHMRSSLLFSGADDHVEIISDNALSWGTSDPKAIIHQQGTSRIPARPFVGMTSEALDKTAEIIADATVAALV